jgi:ParB-like chromosome segregation protein Spo0J
MKAFGFTVPLVVDEQGTVLAGHGRLSAAKQLGMKSVPVVRIDHLSETQKRAYLLADNKIALSWRHPSNGSCRLRAKEEGGEAPAQAAIVLRHLASSDLCSPYSEALRTARRSNFGVYIPN